MPAGKPQKWLSKVFSKIKTTSSASAKPLSVTDQNCPDCAKLLTDAQNKIANQYVAKANFKVKFTELLGPVQQAQDAFAKGITSLYAGLTAFAKAEERAAVAIFTDLSPAGLDLSVIAQLSTDIKLELKQLKSVETASSRDALATALANFDTARSQVQSDIQALIGAWRQDLLVAPPAIGAALQALLMQIQNAARVLNSDPFADFRALLPKIRSVEIEFEQEAEADSAGYEEAKNAVDAYNNCAANADANGNCLGSCPSTFAAPQQPAGGGTNGSCQPRPPGPPMNLPWSGPSGGGNAAGPQDPNDLFGPAGFGAQNFVAANQALPYTIDFQNEPTATLPAQQVVINQQLDPNLNLASFRLGSFGFGGQIFQVPANSAFYQTTIDLSQTAGYDVQVSATIDVQTGIATWIFTTIDPMTGQIPLDFRIGFLPPDDSNGSGEGFVSYTIDAKSTAATGTVIKAQALVTFDTQPPLNTPKFANTLDTGLGLTSVVAPLPATETSPQFDVSWSGSDNAAGSGLDDFTIFVSDNGGTSTPWLQDTSQTDAIFTGQAGHRYAFYSIARDNVGNLQPTPLVPDTMTTVFSPLTITALTPPTATEGVATGSVTVATFTDGSGNQNTSGLSATIAWGDGQSSTATVANGGIVASGNGEFSIQESHTYAEVASGLNFAVTIQDGSGASQSATGKVNVADAALTDTTPTMSITGTEGLPNTNIVLATFTDANPNALATDFSISSLNWGGSLAGTAPTVSVVADASYSGPGSGWKVVANSVTYADMGAYTVALTVHDVDGSNVSSTHTSFVIADAALTDTTPTMSINGTEGLPNTNIVLATFTDANPNALATDFSISSLNWGGSLAGTAPTVSVVADASYSGPGSGWKVVANSVTYADMGAYTVALTVHDVDGSNVSSTHTSFVIADAALTDTTPTMSINGTEGLPNTNIVLATFTDGNPTALASDFSISSLNWGGSLAGTTPTVSVVTDASYSGPGSGWKVVANSVTYAEKGTFTVALTVHDTDGYSLTSNKTQFSMVDGLLTNTTQVVTLNAIEGQTTGPVILATFTDADPLAPMTDFTANVTWGGAMIGTPAVAVQVVSRSATDSTWQVVANAIYAEKGTYTATVKIIDVDGSSIQTSNTTFNVADAPLTDTTSARTISAIRGKSTGYFVLATFTDGNPYATAADFNISVNWGGPISGTPVIRLFLMSRSAAGTKWAVVANVDFSADGIYLAAVTITDSDGTSIVSKKTKFNVTG